MLYGGLIFSLVSFTPGLEASAMKDDPLDLNSIHSNSFMPAALQQSPAQAATTVRGKVVSAEDGEGLPGVTIRVQGTNTGTTTDLEGNFSLEVPSPESVLVISSIGFKSQEIRVGNQTNFNVSLESDIEELSEVVVVGYGVQKKVDVTGAIGSVSGEAIAERGTVSPLQAVQGQVAGVDISAGSGRAGASFDIQIRGQNSLQGGSPLFVVDGVIVENIDFLNPQDIERIDILKDASSTAIFGSRGSNGVVQVTTKKGANVKGETTISYDGYVGMRQNVRSPDFMSGDEWWEYRQNSYIVPETRSGNPFDATVGGLGGSPTLTRRVALRQYTDWPGYFLQNGLQQNHWLTISGTSQGGLNYVIGGGFQEEEGNLYKDLYRRYNFKASVNHKISDKWTAGATVNLALSKTERGSQNAVRTAYRMSPLVVPYDEDGNLIFQPAKVDGIGFTSSPNPLIETENSQDETRDLFGVANLYLQYSPLKWLDLRSTISPRFEFERQGIYEGPFTERGRGQFHFASMEREEEFSYTLDNLVTVNHSIGDHNINVMGLHSLWYEREEGSFIDAEYLPYNSSFYNLGTTGRNNTDVDSYFDQVSLISYLIRANYNYQDKYLLTLSNRWDGSSKLAIGYKWSSFPSAAIGWRISEENFMKDVNWIYNLKARLSYGYTGNNNIDPYTTQTVANNQTFYSLGGNPAMGFAPSGIVNRALTWERTGELNFGLDYDLFRGRVSGSFELYNKLSTSLLMERELPWETGWGAMTDNIGSVRNKGVELSVRTVNIQTGDLTWTTSFNFSRNINEIVSLYGEAVDDPGNLWFIGQPIDVNYHFQTDGVWQAGDDILYGQTEGEGRVRDLSGPNGVPDGRIDAEYDMTILGTPIPSWTGGFSTSFRYKGFDLSASLFTRQGVHVYSPFHETYADLHDRGRQRLNVNYYMFDNPVTRARASNEYPMPQNVGAFWRYDNVAGEEAQYYRDASFVKVQNIVLGYNLPSNLVERANIKNLRVYFNVLNPFVFTDFDGFDPEWAAQSVNNQGNAFVTYQLGVNLKF